MECISLMMHQHFQLAPIFLCFHLKDFLPLHFRYTVGRSTNFRIYIHMWKLDFLGNRSGSYFVVQRQSLTKLWQTIQGQHVFRVPIRGNECLNSPSLSLSLHTLMLASVPKAQRNDSSDGGLPYSWGYLDHTSSKSSRWEQSWTLFLW